MPSTPNNGIVLFGLLPEPERNPASVATSALINTAIIALFLFLGTFARHELTTPKMESLEIELPISKPPEIKQRVKVPPTPKAPDLPKPAEMKITTPKILMAKAEPRPELKPLPMIKEQVNLPKIEMKQSVILAPQPKAALAAAAAPALTPQPHVSTQAVHFGDLNGATPNPNATRPATVAALGNPYGGSNGEARAPQGKVGSTGFGNGVQSGSNAGTVGRVASAGIPGGTAQQSSGLTGHVASAGMPAMAQASAPPPTVMRVQEAMSPPVLISYAKATYTSEALQMKIQGEVVLRVTVTSAGQMVVQSVLHGLGHGLDESAIRSAPTYRFKPAMRNGQPVDYTTNIIVKFQTA